MLQICTEIEQKLNLHFKKCLWFWFFSFLVNCKYFRTSQTQLCFTIFSPCLCHFYINSHHVARLAMNGQSENKGHKLQLVRERQLCQEQSRHKGRTNCMNFMLSVQCLTGLYYFDRLFITFYMLLNHEKRKLTKTLIMLTKLHLSVETWFCWSFFVGFFLRN